MKDLSSPLVLKSSEAIFAVADVLLTLKFYREILGFEGEWLWGEPPTFAGLRWGKVQVMLCQQTDLALKVEGHQHFFYCDDIDTLHVRHKALGAPIISDIENKPWGTREYTVKDNNGYHLRFAGPQTFERSASARQTLPDCISLIERLPTVEEFTALAAAVGWNSKVDTAAVALRHSLYSVVAVENQNDKNVRVVGSVRVTGDGARYLHIQDVMVIPERQQQRIGSAMMELVMIWLKTSAPKGAYVGLFTQKPAFYERFGFQSGSGMSLQM